jgi:hypothetical protein
MGTFNWETSPEYKTVLNFTELEKEYYYGTERSQNIVRQQSIKYIFN